MLSFVPFSQVDFCVCAPIPTKHIADTSTALDQNVRSAYSEGDQRAAYNTHISQSCVDKSFLSMMPAMKGLAIPSAIVSDLEKIQRERDQWRVPSHTRPRSQSFDDMTPSYYSYDERKRRSKERGDVKKEEIARAIAEKMYDEVEKEEIARAIAEVALEQTQELQVTAPLVHSLTKPHTPSPARTSSLHPSTHTPSVTAHVATTPLQRAGVEAPAHLA